MVYLDQDYTMMFQEMNITGNTIVYLKYE